MNRVRECVQWSRLIVFVFVMGIATLLMSNYAYADIGMDYLIKHNLSAKIYETNEYSAGGEGVSLSNQGSTLENWDYDESRFLQIDILVDANPNEVHIIELKLAPIFYNAGDIEEVPAGYSKVEHTKSASIMCNNGTYEYSLNNGSGTFKYYLKPNMTRASIQVELRYDDELWDKFGGSTLTEEGVNPIEVSIYHEESIIDNTLEVNASKIKLSKALSGRQIMGDGSVWYKRNHDSGDAYWDPADDFYAYKDKPARIMVFTTEPGREYVRKYYKKMKLEIDVPYVEDDGKKVYVGYDKSSFIFHGMFGTPDNNVNIEKATESTLIISVDGYYAPDDNILGVSFVWPEGYKPDDTVEEVTFEDGHIRIKVIDNSGNERLLGKKDLGYIRYSLKQKEDVYVTCEPVNNVIRSKYPSGANDYLANVLIGNYGTGDSTKKNVKFTFNKKHMVTGMVLPIDTEQKNLKITYTLKDENGEDVYLDNLGRRVTETDKNGENKWTVEVKNDAYNTYKIDNIGSIFTITQLPGKHRQYYFKTIQYKIESIKTRMTLFDNGDNRYSIYGTGNVYGKLSKDATVGEIIENTVTLTSPEGSGIEPRVYKFKSKVSSTETASYGIKYSKFGKTSLKAGESVITAGQIFVNYRHYQADATWLHDIRLALVVPKGVSVDKESISIKTTGTKKVVKVDDVKKLSRGDKDVWVIDIDKNQYIGYYSDNLKNLSQGAGLDYSMKLNTDMYMDTVTINTSDMLYVMGKNQENVITTCDSGYRYPDIYDIDDDGNTSENIGRTRGIEGGTCTVNGDPPKLYIDDDVRVVDKDGNENEEDIIAFPTDVVEYSLNIKSVNDGSASSFDYYIPIPRKDSAQDDYLYKGEEDKSFDLALLEGVSLVGDQIYTIEYTTNRDMTYNKARDASGASWYTLESLNSAGKALSDVTMVKISVKNDKNIEKGMDTTITLKMGYNGLDIITDNEKYLKWNSCGYYDYDDTVKFISGHFPTNGVIVNIEADESLITEIIFTEEKDGKYYMYDVADYESVSVSEPITFYVKRPEGSENVIFTISEIDTYTDTSKYLNSNNVKLVDDAGNIVTAVNNQYMIKPNREYSMVINQLAFGTSTNKNMDVYMYARVNGILTVEHIMLVRVTAFTQH